MTFKKIVFILLSAYSVNLIANNKCSGLFEKSIILEPKLVRTSGGSATEIEIQINELSLNLLTTIDGKAISLFNGHSVPAIFFEIATTNFTKEPSQLMWDELSYESKMNLIREVSKDRTIEDFKKDRTFKTLFVKQKLKVVFNVETVLFGKKYAAGVHEVDVSNYFGKVEYGSLSANNNFRLVELHLRSSELSAGELLESAWNLQKGIGLRRHPMHEHIVAKLPLKSLKKDPVLTGAEITEFFRRSNLLAEFITILKGGKIIDKKSVISNPSNGFKAQTVTHFGPISQSDLVGIYSFFSETDIKYFSKSRLEELFKMGWIGFRGPDLYDQPNMFGFEYRSIQQNDKVDLLKKVVNKIQISLETESYGFQRNALVKWSIENEGVSNTYSYWRLFHKSWYNTGNKLNLELDPIEAQKRNRIDLSFLNNGVGKPFNLKLETLKFYADNNFAVKMLTYDWSKDFLLFGDAKMQKEILDYQKTALIDILDKNIFTEVAMKDFILKSGLLSKLAQNFQLEPSDFENIIEQQY